MSASVDRARIEAHAARCSETELTRTSTSGGISLLEVIDDPTLRSLLERCKSEVVGRQVEAKEKIGYHNIFHTAWDEEANRRYEPVVTRVLNKINEHETERALELGDVLYAGFIYSYPNNDSQSFHYDYDNTTDTYFIPLVDLSHLNGTEFLYFHDATHYKKYADVLRTINNRYTSSDDVARLLTRHGVCPSMFTFAVYSARAFSLYKLARNVFHRGKTNETGSVRVMFQLATMHERAYARNVATTAFQADAELDDALSTRTRQQSHTSGRRLGEA
jgi:hypothetical protein